MANFSLSQVGATGTGARVNAEQFAANALHGVNFESGGSYAPTEAFAAAVEAVGIRHLRFPGGHVENTIDVTRLENGRVRAEIRAFLDWCVANSTPGNEYRVTFVLPTKVNYSQGQISNFVHALMSEYGQVISAFEIGNEYSIGTKVTNADRSVHPEYIPGSDFIAAMNEAEYGLAANRAILGVQDALDRLAAADPHKAYDPAILLQMGDPTGAASSYKGSGNFDLANEAILSMLSNKAKAAIDGAVAHYYYNKDHADDPAFAHDWKEIRRIDQRLDNFNDHLGRDVDLYVTEWNVLTSNYDQLGIVGASVILEMFENLVRLGVKDAHIWPLQHQTGSTMAGTRLDGQADLSITGTALKMMSDSLAPMQSTYGHDVHFESMDSSWTGASAAVEINHYSSVYGDVLYISLRADESARVTLDLSRLLAGTLDREVRQLTVDRSSSDGLSDYADANGQNRIARRTIDQTELDALRRLAFFDESDKAHVTYKNGNIQTYLPDPDTIFPLVANPRTIDDYYFAGEADVRALLRDVSGQINAAGQITLTMLPYEVVEIVTHKAWQKLGSNGGDLLVGGAGSDLLIGLNGDDTLRAVEGDDTLMGGWGNDVLLAGFGDDLIVAGGGNDSAYGHAGNDTIQAGIGNSYIDGGEGWDVAEVALTRSAAAISQSGTVVTLRGGDFILRMERVEAISFTDGRVRMSDLVDQAPSSEVPPPIPVPGGLSLTGTLGNDTLNASHDNDTVRGLAGNDTVFLYRGHDHFEDTVAVYVNDNDTVFGGDGNDTIIGLGGNESFYGQWGNDLIRAVSGTDLLFGGDGNDTIFGGAGNDTLYGKRHDDVLHGGDGLDLVNGDAGNDLIYGEAGGDTLRAGTGDDTVFGGGGRDTAWLGAGNDVYNDDADTGVNGRDTVYGCEGNDLIRAGAGNDLLYGNLGNDTIYGQLGDDLIFGGAHRDVLFGDGGNDTIIGGYGRDRAYMGDGNDIWLDNDEIDFGHDVVFGGTGNDTIYSRRGNDTLTGGADADTFVFAERIDDDVITDFDLGVDRLHLDAALWGGVLGGFRMADIATVETGNLVLDFGGGHSLTLLGVDDAAALLQDITLV